MELLVLIRQKIEQYFIWLSVLGERGCFIFSPSLHCSPASVAKLSFKSWKKLDWRRQQFSLCFYFQMGTEMGWASLVSLNQDASTHGPSWSRAFSALNKHNPINNTQSDWCFQSVYCGGRGPNEEVWDGGNKSRITKCIILPRKTSLFSFQVCVSLRTSIHEEN